MTVRIRPFSGDEKIAEIISQRTGLSVIDVMSLALQAGLKAIEEDDYRMDLPIRFKVVGRGESPTTPEHNPDKGIKKAKPGRYDPGKAAGGNV